MIKRRIRGFSLVEVLIVVSLIMLLTGIIGFGAANQLQKGNDVKRKFHLAEFAKSFESYHNDHACYPTKSQWDQAICNQSDSFLSGYIKQFYCDPERKEKYVFVPTDQLGNFCEGQCGQCYGYKLYATLSNKSDSAIAESGCDTPLGCGYTDAKGRSVNYGVTSGGMAVSHLSLLDSEEFVSQTRDIVFTGLGNGLEASQSAVTVNDRPKSEASITRKVMVLDYNPILSGGSTVRDTKHWTNPLLLEQKFIRDIASASGNFLQYKIVARVDNINQIPIKEDGFSYSAEQYLSVVNGQTPSHEPDMPINYMPLLEAYGVCEKFNAKTIDEVWIWSGPNFGFWPIVEAGSEAVALRSPPIIDSTCEGALVISSFRYDLDMSNMHERFAQRVENKLATTFQEFISPSREPTTLWGEFSKNHAWFPDESQCGLSTFPPNAPLANDFSNTTTVPNLCDDWNTYPTRTSQPAYLTCARWGCNKYGYLLWWFSHIPRVEGESGGYLNNWWRYVVGVF